MLNRTTVFVIVFGSFLLAALNLWAQQPLPTLAETATASSQEVITAVELEGLDDHDETSNGMSLTRSNAFKVLRESKTNIAVGQNYNRLDLKKAISVFKELLSARGYRDSQITVDEQKTVDNKVSLTFVIKRGEQTRVTKIEFVGNKVFTNEELVATLKNAMGANWDVFDAGKYEYYLRKYTLPFVQSKGYLKAQTSEPVLKREGNSLKVSIGIEENTRYRAGKVEIKGANAVPLEQINKIIALNSGEVVNGSILRTGLYEHLEDEYAKLGYIDYSAEVEPNYTQPAAKDQDGIVDYKIFIDEGFAFKISKIEFQGVDETIAKQLRETIYLKDGDFFNREELNRGIERINAIYDFNLDRDKDTEHLINAENKTATVLVKVKSRTTDAQSN